MLDSKATGELPLLRELSALQKARALRDPSTASARSSHSVRAGSGGRRAPRDRAARRDEQQQQQQQQQWSGDMAKDTPSKPKAARKGKVRPTESGNADDHSLTEWSGEFWAEGDGFARKGDAAEGNAPAPKQKPPRPPHPDRPQPRGSKTLENWESQSWTQDPGGGGRDRSRAASRREDPPAGSRRNDEAWREEVVRRKERLLRENARRVYRRAAAEKENGSAADARTDEEQDFTDASEVELSTDMIELDNLTPRPRRDREPISQSQSPLLLRDGMRGRDNASASRRRRSRRQALEGLGIHAALNAEEEDLDVSAHFPRNGCGMPWYWSKIHKYKGRNILDIAGRSLACGSLPEPRRHGHGGRGASRRRSSDSLAGFGGGGAGDSDHSHSDLDTDTDALLRSAEKYARRDRHRRLQSGSLDLDADEEARNYLTDLGYAAPDDGAKSFLQLGSLFWTGQIGATAESRHRSLSQKYRPRSFKELVGQNLVVKALSSAVTQGKIAPVYLFQGPRGTGKTSTARIFAAVLNCLADSLALRPCGNCRECLALASRRSLDVTELHVATNSGIESMRELVANVLVPPTTSRFRIFIIDECHMLSKEAWNGFLKCLEEPPERVVFLLITTDPEQLPRTAASRCQKFSFFNIKESEIVSRLTTLAAKENLMVDEEALALIASQSDGSLRDAETMLDQLSLLGKSISLDMVQELVGLVADSKLVDLLDMALSADTVSTVKCIRELLEAGAEPLALVNQLATLITNILAGSYKLTEVQRMAGFFQTHNLQEESESLRQALKVLSEAEKQLRISNDRTTWLTAALLQFAPDRSSLFPTSSGGTSVSESPGGKMDGGEKEKDTGEVYSSTVEQQWDGQGRFQTAPSPAALSLGLEPRRSVSKNEGVTFVNFAEAKVYPAVTSPRDGDQVHSSEKKAPKTEAMAEGEFFDPVTQPGLKDFTTLSHRKLDDIWKRVLEGIRSLVLKEILQVQGRLLSLSLSDSGYAVAVIEFRHPDHKSRAQRSRSTIAHAFHMAVGCPVEVKLSLACMPEEGDDIKPRKREQHSGPVLNHSERQTAAVSGASRLEEAEIPLDKKSDVLSLRRQPADTAYRKSQQGYQGAEADKGPSVSSSTTWNSGVLPTADAQRFNGHGSEILHAQDEDHLENLWTRDHKYAPIVQATKSPEQLWGLKDGQELQKETVFSTGTKKVSLGTVMRQAQGFEPENDYATRLSKRRVAKHFQTNGDEAIRAIEQENLRLESRVSNASLLCWKPSTQDEEEVKHNYHRRLRKRDFFLKLVPCAKKSE